MIPKRIVAAIGAMCLIASCAPTASLTPQIEPSSSPLHAEVSSSALASPTSLPTASPTRLAKARPGGWIQIGQIGATERIEHLLAFRGGYVGVETTQPDGIPVAWHSADGVAWTKADLAKATQPCPGWTVRPDGEALAEATNGNAILLVGVEYAPEAPTCGTEQATAWLSQDGTTWTRAPGFGAAVDGDAWSEDAWATPDGWEVIVKSPNKIGIWRSPDGLTWSFAADVAQGDLSVGAHAISSDGTRLLVINDFPNESSRLLTSHDGIDWREAIGPPRTGGDLMRFLAPGTGSSAWMAVATDDGASHTTTWTSDDLEQWTDHPFPMPTIQALTHTRDGVLALGVDPCRDAGGPCSTDPSQYFVSRDGAAWAPLDAAAVSDRFVDGDMGIIGIGQPAKEADPRPVWRLEPYSTEETVLFDGLRPDARFACSARRSDLPDGAVAGIECSPDVDGIERVGAYLFRDQAALLDTYFQRLADNGVKPRSGPCPDRAGEVSYVPGDEGASVGPYRYGCYVNEFGVANYRFTDPEYLVYVGILGTGKDMKRLHDWAWRGNQDVPGAPTVWRGNAYGP